jgi:adenylate cyclase
MTAIGDAVNFASRIEAANKPLGTSLLISEATYSELRGRITVNPCHFVEIPGKSGRYRLYEVIEIATPQPQTDFSEISTLIQPRSRLQRLTFKLRSLLHHCWTRLMQALRS